METIVKQEESVPPPGKAVVSMNNDSLQPAGRESREESQAKREQMSDEREDTSEQKTKPSLARSKVATAPGNKKGGRFAFPNKMTGRAPYPMVRGGGGPPYGPPPYGYMNSSFGPPPPPYHPPPHMPLPPYAGAPFPGHLGGGGGGAPPMKGPNNYTPHPSYHGPPYGMPPTYPHQQNSMPSSYPNVSSSSDSVSISSKGSLNSKKKRTIDGVHNNANNMQPAYSFRQTDSSSASTMTTANNTSMETDESQQRRDRSEISVLSMDGMVFEDRNQQQNHDSQTFHRRNYSAASTASSLSVCGFSLASYEGQRAIHEDGSKGPTKRHKKNDRAPLVVDTNARPSSSSSNSVEADQSTRFEQLSIENKEHPLSTNSGGSSASGRNIFLSLSTSPINANADVDATPVKANTTKREGDIFKSKKTEPSNPDRPSDTPTPPVHGELGDTEANDDHSMLNRHLRGQSFTPLPHISSNENATTSPSNTAFASAIAPQLSWSIAGDTPSLGDLAEWEEENNSKLKNDQKVRPSSTTSTETTRNMQVSPHDFHMWKEEHEMPEHPASGTTTPLPVFFEQSSNENTRGEQQPRKVDHYNESNQNLATNITSLKSIKQEQPALWGRADGNLNPTPMFTGSEFRDDSFQVPVRSPHHSDRRDSLDFFHAFSLLGHGGPADRIRNLRGRVHPGSHLPPLPLHIPPPLSAHLPMTSPMGLGKGLWSPHGLPGSLASPHHMASPLASMAQSKRKCVPLKPPIPSKFQGDIEKTKNVPVPEFTSLVNFPSHMSQKQAVNLPEGMRCCVMCGQACPCSTGTKAKKSKSKSSEGRASQRNDHIGDKNSGFAIIPTQNKGLCTLCDVNVWVVVTTGLEIKWCKGCKNFRPWAAFGDKGLATKCLRCRERQREKYALQKEEKEKARAAIMSKSDSS